MRVEINHTSPCKKEVHIELPAEQVTQAFNQTYSQFARRVVVPGFRPGKAPQSIIRTRFNKEIRDEVIRTLVPRVVQDAVVENKLAVIGEPTIDDLILADGQPLKLKLSVEVIPEIEISDYRGLNVTKKIRIISDEDVEKAILKARQSQASLIPVEDDRSAQEGDFAEFALTGYVLSEGDERPAEGADPAIPRHEEEIQIGDPKSDPVFSEQLNGLKVNETREFTVLFEEQHGVPDLVGKNVFCQAELLSLRVQELPELDDAFAQGLPGEFKDMADLREKLREKFERDVEKAAIQQVHDDLVNQLIERTGVEVPDTLVHERAKERLEMVLGSLFPQGLDKRLAEKLDWKALLDDQLQPARRDIQRALILAKIGEAEKIDPTEAEVEHEIAHIAEHSGESPAAVRARLTREGGLDSIRNVLRHRKTLQFLLESANVSIETVVPPNAQSASVS